MARIHLLITTIASLAALTTVGTAMAAPTVSSPISCGNNGYSYAGVTADKSQSGISAGITALSLPKVTTGHVAAWVGVGGTGVGPGGSNEWLQAGISAAPGQATSLYYELATPGAAPRYHVLPVQPHVGHTYEIAVQESTARANWWSVWIDGRQATSNVYLPGSHDAWKPVATTESWDGGSPACNAYSFKFSDIQSKTSAGPVWSPMGASVIDAPGYEVTGRTLVGFTAVGGKL